MKKHLRKLVAFISVLVMAISMFPSTAGAAGVGDVIGYAQPTDIIATINGYQLESYNVNGLTYICVEDLRYYGFDVTYDNSTRSLSVTRNSETYIDPQNTNPDFWNIGSNKVRKPILYTDIVTYVNSNYVASSNINGRTIINFNELSSFGAVNYDNDRREISLMLDAVNYNEIATLATQFQDEYYNSNWTCLARAKGDLLILRFTSRNYMSQSDVNHYLSYYIPTDKSDIREALQIFKDNGWNISSIYAECYNSNGGYITSFQIN